MAQNTPTSQSSGNYILKHDVDISCLQAGFAIGNKIRKQFLQDINIDLPAPGTSKFIKILLEGEEYDVKLININIDRNRYPDAPPLLQINYGKNSPIAQKLRAIFHSSWKYLTAERLLNNNRNRLVRVPAERREHIVLYTSPFQDVILMECITAEDRKDESEEINKVSEVDFEFNSNALNDSTAAIKTTTKKVKMRKLDRSIITTLKEVYDYRCQITGERIGDKYSALVVEAHHIEPFTTSLNNNADNIIILSPTFHRIIHKENPTFVRNNLEFVFPNGVKEKVRLDYHLRAK